MISRINILTVTNFIFGAGRRNLIDDTSNLMTINMRVFTRFGISCKIRISDPHRPTAMTFKTNPPSGHFGFSISSTLISLGPYIKAACIILFLLLTFHNGFYGFLDDYYITLPNHYQKYCEQDQSLLLNDRFLKLLPQLQ